MAPEEALRMRRMAVVRQVCLRMVVAMMRRPPQRAALHGARPEKGKDKLRGARRLERAMREIAMVESSDREHANAEERDGDCDGNDARIHPQRRRRTRRVSARMAARAASLCGGPRPVRRPARRRRCPPSAGAPARIATNSCLTLWRGRFVGPALGHLADPGDVVALRLQELEDALVVGVRHLWRSRHDPDVVARFASNHGLRIIR